MVRGSDSGCATVQPGAARFWNKNFLDYHPAHGFSNRLSIADRVMGAARGLPVEKRDILLQRIAAMLALRGYGRFTDTDVADVAQLRSPVSCRRPPRQRERRPRSLAFVDTVWTPK
jgi:hypothetical protein